MAKIVYCKGETATSMLLASEDDHPTKPWIVVNQSAPDIYVASVMFNLMFKQDDTDAVVERLRAMADFIDRSVAR